jgi:hypothetical protein
LNSRDDRENIWLYRRHWLGNDRDNRRNDGRWHHGSRVRRHTGWNGCRRRLSRGRRRFGGVRWLGDKPWLQADPRPSLATGGRLGRRRRNDRGRRSRRGRRRSRSGLRRFGRRSIRRTGLRRPQPGLQTQGRRRRGLVTHTAFQTFFRRKRETKNKRSLKLSVRKRDASPALDAGFGPGPVEYATTRCLPAPNFRSRSVVHLTTFSVFP